ncbi:protein IQ-DOMAIN 14-like [Cucurbita maxima]|uniref:Protein IQ-DOMAIN 14-like n=1 Tax=Cucurbita maxima TaxID=3661 RepID=A0A6J1K2B9_CUCMA|nr:protein IQ-DOMAIN 14-like [Cucurbita maxima]
MGKAFKWFRSLLGLKKPDPLTPNNPNSNKLKPKWHFAKSYKDNTKTRHHDSTASNPDHHAVAIAAASAAVAEAAVAAAHAAAAVVKLTNSGRSVPSMTVAHAFHEAEWAAIKIQAAFRGFLARKALRALRGLVKLQALVRGHIERKRTAEWIQRMQALLRAQARARSGRSQCYEVSHSDIKSSSFSTLDPATPEKFEHSPHTRSTRFKQMQRSGSRFTTIDVEKIDRILEIENDKTQFKLKPKSLFSSIKLALSSELPSSKESETQCPFKFSHEVEESSFFSVSSRGASTKKSPFTPTKSDSTRSYFSGDLEYPSYMACTESSRAKMRSYSAPRQRPQYERSSSAKRGSAYGVGESRLTPQQVSTLQSNFVGKAYPGSGRLDQLGMPVGYRY